MLLNQKTDFTEHESLRVLIVSDTHEDLDERIKILSTECDIAIHAGDIGSYDALEGLKPRMGHVSAVAGNNDKPYLWDFKYWHLVKNLPHVIELVLPGGILAIEHGHEHDMYKPSHDDLRNAHPNVNMVIYGHTHKQVFDRESESTWVINPGAAGFTRNQGGPSCMILNATKSGWEIDTIKYTDEAA